jgi:hypothetical protein
MLISEVRERESERDGFYLFLVLTRILTFLSYADCRTFLRLCNFILLHTHPHSQHTHILTLHTQHTLTLHTQHTLTLHTEHTLTDHHPPLTTHTAYENWDDLSSDEVDEDADDSDYSVEHYINGKLRVI